MSKPFFFTVAALLFLFASFFYFLRLMFNWQISICEWSVPTWISGLIIILGTFMVYWSIKLSREKADLGNQTRENTDL